MSSAAVDLKHETGGSADLAIAKLSVSAGETSASAPDHQGPTFVSRAHDAIDLLEQILNDHSLLSQLTTEERARLLSAAGKVSRPDAAQRRQLVKQTKRLRKAGRVNREEKVLQETGIRKLRREPVFVTPQLFAPKDTTLTVDTVNDEFSNEVASEVIHQVANDAFVEQNCYICKKDYQQIHHFYDQLCPECAEFNYAKRTETANLSGRVALLTGGRVKIGYQAGIKLLRAGASLIVTTRFPRDASLRFSAEEDFEDWKDRLQIFGLDLRHTPSVEAFCSAINDSYSSLDFIVNNACQTVRRPSAFYAHMMELEEAAANTVPASARSLLSSYEELRSSRLLPAIASAGSAPLSPALSVGVSHSARLSQVKLLPEDSIAISALFPSGHLDQDMQQIDLRDRNSWRMQLDEVSAVELLEVQLVNAVAPFILNARLKSLMMRTETRDKHIVNVSAVEGQFYRRFKTTRHPHTNMAKAALNMMTRTSAPDYFTSGIHMNSVDTGWVTDEDPAEIAARKTEEHRFHPPLDIVDGAARIVDPIIDGINTGHHVWGQFIKDYRSVDW